MWEGPRCHCQPDSWLRWLQRARPSASAEDPAKRKLHPTMGGKAPMEGVPQGWEGKEDQEVLAWHTCSLGDLAVPKEH